MGGALGLSVPFLGRLPECLIPVAHVALAVADGVFVLCEFSKEAAPVSGSRRVGGSNRLVRVLLHSALMDRQSLLYS